MIYGIGISAKYHQIYVKHYQIYAKHHQKYFDKK